MAIYLAGKAMEEAGGGHAPGGRSGEPQELQPSNSEFKPLVESGVRNVEGHLIVLQADGHRLPQV